MRILVGQGYYDNSIMLNIFITTETQPKLTIPFFSRPEKVPTRDMRICVHVLVPAGTMEKSTQWMKKWRPTPWEKMAFLETGFPQHGQPSLKFHTLWVTCRSARKKWRRNKMVSTWGLFMFLMNVEWCEGWKQKYELSPQEGERKTTQKQKEPHSERIYV